MQSGRTRRDGESSNQAHERRLRQRRIAEEQLQPRGTGSVHTLATASGIARFPPGYKVAYVSIQLGNVIMSLLPVDRVTDLVRGGTRTVSSSG